MDTVDVEDGDRSQSWRTVSFTSLDRAAQGEVAALARRGQLHSDPVVAASSVAWANQITARRSRGGRIGGMAFSGALGIAGLFVSALSYVPSSGPNPAGWIREERLAKRVLRAADATGYEAPEWVRVAASRGPRVSVAELARQSGIHIEAPYKSSDGPRRRGRHSSW